VPLCSCECAWLAHHLFAVGADKNAIYRQQLTVRLGERIVKTCGFSEYQLLILALQEKRIITEGEVEKVAKRLVESFRLKNILSPQELKEVRKALQRLKVPDPLGVRASLYSKYMYRIKDVRKSLLLPDAANSLYSRPDDIEELIMALDYAGFHQKIVVRKLEKTLQLAERYMT